MVKMAPVGATSLRRKPPTASVVSLEDRRHHEGVDRNRDGDGVDRVWNEGVLGTGAEAGGRRSRSQQRVLSYQTTT